MNVNSQTKEAIQLTRDCDAIQIPSGETKRLLKGTPVSIIQALGGTYTVVPNSGGMFRIVNRDADALGLKSEESTVNSQTGSLDEKALWEKLRTCYDPEIPVNIVDLGLIYDLKVIPLEREGGGSRVEVKMTLTATGCGMGPSIASDARFKLETVPGVTEADVQVVWEPPWNPSMISEEGKRKLGMA
jgi:probable FeS assembly SUF system protein SufT